jgi:hypothetical protein
MRGGEREREREGLDTHSKFTRFRQVLNPTLSLIGTFLVYFQKAHLHARSREHGDLKFHADGRSRPGLLTRGGQQIDDSIEHRLAVTLEATNAPDNSTHTGLIFRASLCHGDAGVCSHGWHGNLDNNIERLLVGRKRRRTLETHEQLGFPFFSNVGQQAKRLGRGCNSVTHKFKLTIGRNKSNSAVRIKFPKPHTSTEQ